MPSHHTEVKKYYQVIENDHIMHQSILLFTQRYTKSAQKIVVTNQWEKPFKKQSAKNCFYKKRKELCFDSCTNCFFSLTSHWEDTMHVFHALSNVNLALTSMYIEIFAKLKPTIEGTLQFSMILKFENLVSI